MTPGFFLSFFLQSRIIFRPAWVFTPEAHVQLSDVDRHRIELVSAIYRTVYQAFVDSTIWRDDKLAPAIFYLSDFLLKFHRRAFSQYNLEQVDELIHIHRAPELRPVLHALVASWNGLVLHPIRNGMYTYRFRSDIAEELRAASRGSEEELAAFNFTLDESQALKSYYRQRIAKATEPIGHELEAVLGELHELDEELDAARYHYRSAVRLLDDHLQRDVFSGFAPGDKQTAQWSAMFRVLGGSEDGLAVVRQRIHWAVARLRLMLQVGMTHERTKNYEAAIFTYRNAETLADVMIHALVEEQEVGRAQPMLDARPSKPKPIYMTLLKHMNLLYQPVFAQAWAAEKSNVGVDTGPAAVEQALERLRKLLPFVDTPLSSRPKATDAAKVRHANFALSMAELHDKAGDLYFFKGRQPPRPAEATPPAGYLLRAHYHYALSIHEVRAYNRYRRESSTVKLGAGAASQEEHLSAQSWPDFVVQITAGSLCDLAEAILARLSVKNLLVHREDADALTKSTKDILKDLDAHLCEWLNGEATPVPTGRLSWGDGLRMFGGSTNNIEQWVGKPSGQSRRSQEMIELPSSHDDRDRVLAYAALTMTAARLLAKDGRLRDGAREALLVTETIAKLLWWRAVHRRFDGKLRTIPDRFWVTLCEIGRIALAKASRWWDAQQTRDHKSSSGFFSVALEQTEYSFILGARAAFSDGSLRGLDIWERVFHSAPRRGPHQFKSYPMLYRLQSLKSFIDYKIIKGGSPDDLAGLIEDFIELKRRYRAPHQFTYLDAGTTLALAALSDERETIEQRTHVNLVHIARDRLETSEQCTTMRRAYYDTIADMYYLYDDFNDRRVHHNQALQMAGADLRNMLLAELEKRQ